MKKYLNREAILRDIDSAHRKIKKAKEVAQGFLDEEELLTGTGNLVELRQARENADKQFRKIKRLESVRLPKLGEKLAEMDTMPLLKAETAPTPKQLVEAHQYLYYIASSPIWGDFEYDKFCAKHGIPGNGGSDVASHYSDEIKALAADMLKNPNRYPVPAGIHE